MINEPRGFNITSKEPVDRRFIMHKEDLKQVSLDNRFMPSLYATLCLEDGKLYIYNEVNTYDSECGYFRPQTLGAGKGLKLDDLNNLNVVPDSECIVIDSEGRVAFDKSKLDLSDNPQLVAEIKAREDADKDLNDQTKAIRDWLESVDVWNSGQDTYLTALDDAAKKLRQRVGSLETRGEGWDAWCQALQNYAKSLDDRATAVELRAGNLESRETATESWNRAQETRLDNIEGQEGYWNGKQDKITGKAPITFVDNEVGLDQSSFANDIKLTMDPATNKVTIKLLDKSGNEMGTADSKEVQIPTDYLTDVSMVNDIATNTAVLKKKVFGTAGPDIGTVLTGVNAGNGISVTSLNNVAVNYDDVTIKKNAAGEIYTNDVIVNTDQHIANIVSSAANSSNPLVAESDVKTVVENRIGKFLGCINNRSSLPASPSLYDYVYLVCPTFPDGKDWLPATKECTSIQKLQYNYDASGALGWQVVDMLTVDQSLTYQDGIDYNNGIVTNTGTRVVTVSEGELFVNNNGVRTTYELDIPDKNKGVLDVDKASDGVSLDVNVGGTVKNVKLGPAWDYVSGDHISISASDHKISTTYKAETWKFTLTDGTVVTKKIVVE